MKKFKIIFGFSLFTALIAACEDNSHTQTAYINCGSATDFKIQLNSAPFSKNKFSSTWGPSITSYPQAVCNNIQWQQERVMAAYENIAIASKWNYCHHHSASWFPGLEYSYNQSSGANANSATLKTSLYCSSHSFYIGSQNIGDMKNPPDFRTKGALSGVTSAYRWNSEYAQNNVPNWSSIVSQETSPANMGVFLSQLYPANGAGVDPIWASIASNGKVDVIPASPNFSAEQKPSSTYPRQSTSQFLNGVDCSNLTAWAYSFALNKSFDSLITAQAGQPVSGINANATAQTLCLNPSQQATGAAGQFVTYNGQVISSSVINNNNLSPILNTLQPGDLLFITTHRSPKVVHVITWTGKKVGKPNTGITASTVALDLIAPAEANSNTGRTIGDWVIIDSHYQGADFRDFSGWYTTSLWGVRRVIGASTPQCTQ